MVRLGDSAKETSLEALLSFMRENNMAQRPRPQQATFCVVITSINHWKGNNFWEENKLNEDTKSRDVLLMAGVCLFCFVYFFIF